jgi:hypothetical protein
MIKLSLCGFCESKRGIHFYGFSVASVSGRRARVTFDYEATENDELTLVTGQIIDDVTDEDVGWCKGFIDGKTGLFPNNFVEFISDPEKPPPPEELKPSKGKREFLIKNPNSILKRVPIFIFKSLRLANIICLGFSDF